MTGASGYVLNVSAARSRDLAFARDWHQRLAEAVPEFSHSRNIALVCFISFKDGKLTHLGKAKRGWKSATGLRRLNVEFFFELPSPIVHADIISRLSPRIRSYAEKRLSSGGLLPEKSFSEIVDAVRALSPATRSILDQFSEDRRQRIAGISEGVKAALTYQKETVATALAISDVDRSVLQAWDPSGGTSINSCFLDGLSAVHLREDAMIVNDMMKVPGFNLVKTTPHTSAVFENEKTKLTIVMANRLPLEKQFGADLVYYNETYKAFVIVQYKAMEKNHRGAYFSLPDEGLTEEISRMDATLKVLKNCQPAEHRDGFRLNENPFYLKLCPRLVFNPDNAGLAPGMYLPLDYWRFVESDETLVGPRGGRQITYDNIGRYFDNTSFIHVVGNAWVGTTTSQSLVLESAIREILASGRTVTLAVKEPRDPPDADGATQYEYLDIDAPEHRQRAIRISEEF